MGIKENVLDSTIEKVRLLLIDAVIVVLAWGGFYRSKYGCEDALWDIISPEATRVARLENFRWGGYLVDQIMYLGFHFVAAEHFRIVFFVFLLFLIVSLYLIQIAFWPTFKEELASTSGKTAYIAAISLIVVHVIFSELFYFTDSFSIFEFMMLFLALGFLCYSRKHSIFAFLCFLAAASFYQVGCAFAAVLIATYVYLQYDGTMTKQMFVDELVGILLPISAGAINLFTGGIVLRILASHGVMITSGFEANPIDQEYILKAISEIRTMYLSGLELMIPFGFPLIIAVISTILVIAVFVSRRAVNQLLTFLVWKVVTFILTFAIDLADGAVLQPRTVLPFCALQAVDLLVALYFVDRARWSEKWKRIAVKVSIALPILYLLVQIFFIQNIISNRMVSNTLDELYANAVLDYIDREEALTGVQVNKFGWTTDAYAPDYYEEVYYTRSEINSRNYRRVPYSLVEINARDRGRHFTHTPMDPEVYQKYFEGKDWDKFLPEEQVVIIDDTAYLCVF